ncbi:hypothetical protein R6242_14550 [Iodobacter sp. CM08]|uniref:hypothetical protein n=1 Tax=Iodobacter sp. CM08 TaxID=3085902 RepID=UPI00298116FA|nr:hypothetical protein [Iodobacter sp. CM08]MDW5417788.1 hypothetical protein [Iodobacter sp. CM08]
MNAATDPSPLFDKMDALLARHRGASHSEAIPVLLDEADDIPVLTEILEETECYAAPIVEELALASFNLELEPEPVIPELDIPVVLEEFMDLPLLDLDALSQANPWGNHVDFVELKSTPEQELEYLISAPAATEPSMQIVVTEVPWSDEQIFDLPALDISEPTVAATLPEHPPLSERAIAELSATVAAQLGVEIATEVEQLTRQHFASLMNGFYEETLKRLITDMSAEVENKLLPRVEALVKEELRKSGH